jgi:oligopeptide transport system substrate-binding protein
MLGLRKNERGRHGDTATRRCPLLLVLVCSLFFLSCSEITSPTPEPFIGKNEPLPKQEFRWSNGKMPKSLDPAKASAAPETDVVRALYEGLVEVEGKNLKPQRGIATKWTHSENFQVWTFELRQNARWSNGEQITAEDFVRSWKRLSELGEKVRQRSLLKNIVGLDSEDALPVFADDSATETETENLPPQKFQTETNINANAVKKEKIAPKPIEPTFAEKVTGKPAPTQKNVTKFGVEAVGKFVLKVTLVHPDSDFPLLVAHPIFRPVYGDGKDFEKNELNPNIVTNGAFRLQTIGKDGIVLARSDNYWNKDAVKLETVKFVPAENAEQALAAYRNGQVDAVTNANFQPLALKLLQPFKNEFQQTAHGALNFYEFNFQQKPFDDSRVRKALAIAIEREHLTEDEMDGATEPALRFLPSESEGAKLEQNVEKGRKLLAQAGFPNGENFPVIKLVVNRNNVQKKIADSVAKMWAKNLNIKTEVIAKDQAEVDNLVQTGEFSLVRRGVVLPTNNETSNMLSLFEEINISTLPEESPGLLKENADESVSAEEILTEKTAESELNLIETESSPENVEKTETENTLEKQIILTQDQALEQIPAIPLYFPTSHSLVKPYIQGFDLNPFDATSLKNVQIDSNWQPTNEQNNSNQK